MIVHQAKFEQLSFPEFLSNGSKILDYVLDLEIQVCVCVGGERDRPIIG